MKIIKNGSQPSSFGTSENFTGHVRRDPILFADTPSRLACGTVTFDPGARTRWHTHPVGQLLVILSGCGRVGTWGGDVQCVKPGDTVWFEPGEKHWHGAGELTAMSHIAITEAVDGISVEWLDQVTDTQFENA